MNNYYTGAIEHAFQIIEINNNYYWIACSSDSAKRQLIGIDHQRLLLHKINQKTYRKILYILRGALR